MTGTQLDHEALEIVPGLAGAVGGQGRVADVIMRSIETGVEQAWAPPPLRYLMTGVRHLPRPLFRRLKT